MDIRDLVAEEDLFDPLEDDGEEGAVAFGGTEGEEDEMPLIGEPLEERAPEPEVDWRPPQVRITELLEGMPGQRRLLLSLIGFCREPKTGAEMDEKTEELKEFSFSVFTPVIFRELLEKAGAIEYLSAEEEAEGEGEAAQENVLHEQMLDGEEEVDIEYLEIEEPKPGLWQATAAGLAIVDEQDDYAAIERLLEKEPQYLPIYRSILAFCLEEEEGRSAREIDVLVNDDPLLEEPRRYSGYFVGRLEREGAVAWRNGWVGTEAGAQILAAIDEEKDAAVEQA